ncbi:hypothetical protein B0I35DRAFT_362805 [Stachybotrys elegans]|uniref:3-dehydrosphinganine reductase n=1 Tax=Stachybotrys elegans TaxID=80388 RepID=A0A8K0WLP0_9HYPO|nr:hypothetical protein B0I35DRAFT_362805 [Stachybotrys elegans]
MAPKTAFQVHGRLAEKGANVVIVARNTEKLLKGLDHVKEGASNTSTQRFQYISADLTSSSEATRVVDETIAWNGGSPPDIVWCCAGASHPTLFVDSPVDLFSSQMQTNYFTGLYMAHAVLKSWLSPSQRDSSGTAPSSPPAPRHLIFTGSVLAFYSFAGYSPYSPCKAALRSLADTLSQEMNLYAAAYPSEPRVRIHAIFPAGIQSEGFDNENRVKSDLTKQLEEGDAPQTPEAIAAKSIRSLESGEEIITTDFQSGLVKRSMLGGSIRGGFLNGLIDWFLAGWLAIIMVFVRGDMDKKVQNWGRQFGVSGMKPKDPSA